MKKIQKPSLRKRLLFVNIGVTMSAILLCGLVLITSIIAIMSKYVDRELNFFLTTTNSKVSEKLSYLEEVVTNVRESEDLLKFGKGIHAFYYPFQKENLEQVFRDSVKISSERNAGRGSEPLVEKVYLFNEKDDFLSSHYYALDSAEIETNNENVKKLFEKYSSTHGLDSFRYYLGDTIYLLYTVYDADMNASGTLAFELLPSAFENILKDLDVYENPFWLLYDERGDRVLSKLDGINEEDLLPIKRSFQEVPFECQIQGQSYKVYKQSLGMGLIAILGFSQNQTLFMIADSVKILLLLLIVTSIVAIAFLSLTVLKVTRPLKHVSEKVRSVREGEFKSKLPDFDSQEFQDISNSFNEMTEYIDHLVNEVYEKKLLATELELKFIQSQMNPHFLFNVLNTIALQQKLDGNEEAYKMMTALSQLIQAKVYRSDKEKVSVRKELELSEYYMFLQSQRFGDRLKYDIQVDDEKLLDLFLPKMCIETIVENAVVHGIEKLTNHGVVLVHVYSENEELIIDVKDNGKGFSITGEVILPYCFEQDENDTHTRVGLNNTHKIIRLMYGEQYGVSVFSRENSGSTVSIHLPFDRNHLEGVV